LTTTLKQRWCRKSSIQLIICWLRLYFFNFRISLLCGTLSNAFLRYTMYRSCPSSMAAVHFSRNCSNWSTRRGMKPLLFREQVPRKHMVHNVVSYHCF
jgi:hypothetical protein